MRCFKPSALTACPNTGKLIKFPSNYRLLRWLFPITGLSALLWFLIRVIPKPSRAAYPCQQMAFPLASAFVIWVITLIASVSAYRKAIRLRRQGRFIVALFFSAISSSIIWMGISITDSQVSYAHESMISNSPLGEAKGILPGRVVWIYDPDATNWTGSDGNTSRPYWYEESCTNQEVVNDMLSKALRTLTGRSSDSEAWDAVFKNFNHQIGRGYTGYSAGQKIAIKVNFVLMYSNPSNGEKPASLRDQIDNSPQLAVALLKQLIDMAGVSPENICIGDPMMIMPNYWYDMVHGECPGVVYLSKSGYTLTGRTQVKPDYSAPFYWSDPITARLAGKQQDYIPTHFAQSDYLINFPVLKSHNDGGITLGGKNHYGSLMRSPGFDNNYYDMHYTRATETPGMGHYRAIVDLLGHPKLGGKTMLTLIDGLYSGRSWDSHPIKWNMAPFNGDWPSSIFLSQDPVAADSVAFDFMDNEWNDSPSNINGFPQKSGASDYLHEAALVPNPPSGAIYNPAGNSPLTKSLGVHEHWNNATDKQYSRNLDPLKRNGIELVTEPGIVGDFCADNILDIQDLCMIAKAWGSVPGDGNWNAACDVSTPIDGKIDIFDLIKFCENWLILPVTDMIQPGATLQEVYSASGIRFEGPIWNQADVKQYWTRRTGNYQVLRRNLLGNVTIRMDNSPQTNAIYLSLDGRLLTANESLRQTSIHRIDSDSPGKTQILIDSSDRFSLQANKLDRIAYGNIYFSIPDWGAGSVFNKPTILSVLVKRVPLTQSKVYFKIDSYL